MAEDDPTNCHLDRNSRHVAVFQFCQSKDFRMRDGGSTGGVVTCATRRTAHTGHYITPPFLWTSTLIHFKPTSQRSILDELFNNE